MEPPSRQVRGPSRQLRGQAEIRVELTPAFTRRFRLVELIGTGAMGLVWRASRVAEDRVTEGGVNADSASEGSSVAIKFLTRLDDPELLQRFVLEGQVLRRVRHGNVVELFDLGELSGHPYLVTELLPGGTLRERLRGGPLTVTAALAVLRDVLAGLAACHAVGVVHRDLKPENILFGRAGEAKLADLGIAKAYGELAEHGAVTQDGMILGTPRYMAPEQCIGEPVGPAADLYALGCVLYEMLAGRPPFECSNIYETMRMHCDVEPRPLADLVPDLPPAVLRVAHQLLAKQAKDRPASAQDAARMVGWTLGQLTRAQAQRTPGRPRALRGAVSAGQVAMVAAHASRQVKALTGRLRSPRGVPLALRVALVLVAVAGLARGAFQLHAFMRPGARELADAVPMLPIPAGRVTLVGASSTCVVPVAPFFLDRDEVTNAQFERFVRATGYVTDAEKLGGGVRWTGARWVETAGTCWRHPRSPADTILGKPELPVVQVSFADASAYARWAGKRLPTEAEWEWAARGGLTGELYPWGHQEPEGRAAFRRRYAEGPERVGHFDPNGYGLYDMAGNAYELCVPVGASAPSIRGGAWNIAGSYLACANRQSLPHEHCANAFTGFRCAGER